MQILGRRKKKRILWENCREGATWETCHRWKDKEVGYDVME